MINRKIVVLISIIVGVFILAVCLPKNPFSGHKTIFKIEKGEGSKDIARNLQRGGFVWYGNLFRFYAETRGISEKMQAGTYEISPQMSILILAEKFADGDIAGQYLTIPEGYTSEQIFERIKILSGFGSAKLEDFEKHQGYLFPDTYKIPYDWNSAEVIQMMLDNFNNKTKQLKITDDILVMASILEKELKTEEDKEIASGLLWKRISAGMPLQVDAAPWTYENRGLPEQPICNPGLESILAALNPKTTAYWYYLSKPDGTTIFSKTFEEHKTAKAKYLK
jgi:UPF0755 protein